MTTSDRIPSDKMLHRFAIYLQRSNWSQISCDASNELLNIDKIPMNSQRNDVYRGICGKFWATY